MSDLFAERHTAFIIHGWTSMIVSIWAIGGLQLLAIGVVGEYIGKIYLETKHRPRYIISERTSDDCKLGKAGKKL